MLNLHYRGGLRALCVLCVFLDIQSSNIVRVQWLKEIPVHKEVGGQQRRDPIFSHFN